MGIGIAETIAQILLVGLQMTEKYIEDPQRRLEARLKTKETMRIQIMEYLKKEKTGAEADIIVNAMLVFIGKL